MVGNIHSHNSGGADVISTAGSRFCGIPLGGSPVPYAGP